MKNFTKISVLALAAAIVLNACSVQQRYHRKGFNVNWNHTSIKVKNDKNKAVVEEEVLTEEVAKITPKKSAYDAIENNTYASTQDAQLIETVKVFSSVEMNEAATIETTSTSFTAPTSTEKAEKIAKKSPQKMMEKAVKKSTSSNQSSEVPTVLLFILCFIIPPVAVGLATDWDLTPVLWNVVWCLLCGFPGVIHAIIHVLRNR
jgi:uncharacterized membrane protein YqaE (UPF0057 family)